MSFDAIESLKGLIHTSDNKYLHLQMQIYITYSPLPIVYLMKILNQVHAGWPQISMHVVSFIYKIGSLA